MSGLYSRNKGKRNEYALRDYLRLQGWTADRVPSSGAAQGFKGDIKAAKNGKTFLFELKTRREQFKKIYALYDTHIRTLQDDVLAIAIPGAKNLCLSLSTSLEAALDGADCYLIMDQHPLYAEYKKTFGAVSRLEKLLGSSDILVLKDDRKPFIFVRFR